MCWSYFRRRAGSICLDVEFDDTTNVPLFVRGVDARVIRLAVRVRFRSGRQWSEPFAAIVDPGSPGCVVPHFIWSVVDHRIVMPDLLPLGVGGERVAAPFGELTLAVEDDKRISPPLTVRAFLLPDDSVPLLLGFQDFLTHAALYCDYPRRVATLEFPTA